LSAIQASQATRTDNSLLELLASPETNRNAAGAGLGSPETTPIEFMKVIEVRFRPCMVQRYRALRREQYHNAALSANMT
jgi:hypothetical protein